MVQKFYASYPFEGSGGGGGSVNSVTASLPLSSSGGTNPNISITQATTISDGYVVASCVTYWNSKANAFTCGNLSSSDITVTGGTGAVIGSGTSMSIIKGNLTGCTPVVITGGTGAVLGSGTSISIGTVLDGYVPTSRCISTTSPLSGGGNLTADRTLSLTTVPINLGGTGQTTAPCAINALLPTQTGCSGCILGTNGTVVAWVASSGATGAGTLCHPTTGSTFECGGFSGSLTGTSNTGLGVNAGIAVTGGLCNTLLGHQSGCAITSGCFITAIGVNAGAAQTTQTVASTFVGFNAGCGATGCANVSIGANTLSGSTTGNCNTAVGANALGNIGTGASCNVGIGAFAGCCISTGTLNIAIGQNALSCATNKTGSHNIGAGFAAGGCLSSGANNVLIGCNAGLATTTGSCNILLGNVSASTAVGSSNEFVASCITNAYIGNPLATAPTATISIQPSGGSGSNVVGSNFVVAGGKSTGNCAPGCLLLQTSTTGSSGATLQTLATRAIVAEAVITACVPIATQLGSASNPSRTFAGDLNTGDYSPGADQYAITTGGCIGLTQNASGFIGITGVNPYTCGSGNSIAYNAELAMANTSDAHWGFRSFLTSTSATGATYGAYIAGVATRPSGTQSYVVGIQGDAVMCAAGIVSTGTYGLLYNARHASSGTNATVAGIKVMPGTSTGGSGTVTNGAGFQSEFQRGVAATWTNFKHFEVMADVGSTTTATNRWGFYDDTAANNHLLTGQVRLSAGSVGTPSLANCVTTNTGIHFPASGAIALGTCGTIGLCMSGAQLITIGAAGGTQMHQLNTCTATAGTAALTMTNGPGSLTRNPAIYVQMTINGTNYAIPAFTLT